ncbi:MAG: SAM-dependent methyltransferase [Burkholderiaceae bacterium]
MSAGALYLVPNALGPGDLQAVLPAATSVIAARLDYFIGENAKSTRAFLKRVGEVLPLARPIQQVTIAELDVSTPEAALPALLAPILAGRDGGLVSEAGCPAIADPGATLVRLAHRRGITVKPLVGPSSILLALMASGLDGQRFAFNGYLATDARERAEAIHDAERRSAQLNQTQLFIETPYRNQALFAALVEHCRPDTMLCVACDLTLETQWISTRDSKGWRGVTVDLQKRPTVFLLLAVKGR